MTKAIFKKFPSKHNGDIQLARENGSYSLLVDNFVQSGVEIEAIWHEAFEKLIPNNRHPELASGSLEMPKRVRHDSSELSPKKILILGFGAGSIVRPLRERFPKSKITAVEIDPVMLEIARKYFPENVTDIEIKNHDALKYIKRFKERKVFDLVVVDCYIGGAEPENIKTIKFLANLKMISEKVLFNQLFIPDRNGEVEKIKFLQVLDKLYSVKVLKLPYNIIIEFYDCHPVTLQTS